MQILLTPVGSAGDVHPLIGLALALRDRGHRVKLVLSGYFSELAERLNLDHVALGTKEEFLQLASDPRLWHPFKGYPYIVRTLKPYVRRQYEIVAEHHRQDPTVVIGPCMAFGARIAREKLGVPLVSLHLQPAVLWSEHESPTLYGMLSGPRVPRWLKRWQFSCGERFIIDRATGAVLNPWRKELGLPPLKRTTHWWHSPDCVLGLFPEWYAPAQPDWPANSFLSDFPRWDEREVRTLPGELEEFLDAGDPPVVFTPGSAMMMGRQFFKAAVAACQLMNRRGILLSPFDDQIPDNLPSSVRHFSYIPFSEVLPRATAVVHHGGIGSTAQSLAAGIPQLIMPMSHDQPDNANRLKRFGVADWVKPSAFRPRRVARMLDELIESPDVQRSCRELALRFDNVDPLAGACEVVERFMRTQ